MQGHDIICDIIHDINMDIKDIGYDIIGLWYHVLLILYIQMYDIIQGIIVDINRDFLWYLVWYHKLLISYQSSMIS